MQVWVNAARAVMRRFALPGASLAVAFEGRVVLEKGLGYADVQSGALAEPGSGYRLASVSKPITATVVGMLIDQHKLGLGSRPFATVLSGLKGPGGTSPADPRLRDITVRELLLHEGGWDIGSLGYDPVFDAPAVDKALGTTGPASCEATIRYMLGVRLNFSPGAQVHYSNFGYCVLSDTIARVTGMPYQAAVRRMLLSPLGMAHTELSADNPAQLWPGEAHFYGQGPEVSGPSSPEEFSMTATLGAAEWVSTAPDLEKWLIATTGARPGTEAFPVWPRDMVAQVSPPPVLYPVQPGHGYWFDFDGSLPGTSTEVGVFGPLTYVFLANSRNPDNLTAYTPLLELGRQWQYRPASEWPPGNLLPG